MNRVIVDTYEDQDGKEVPEHLVNVPDAIEILKQSKLNIQNTTEAIRRRVLIRQNGHSPVTTGLSLDNANEL